MAKFFDPEASGSYVSEMRASSYGSARTGRAAKYEERTACPPLERRMCPPESVPVRALMSGDAEGLNCGVVLCANRAAGGWSLNTAQEGAYSLEPKCAGQKLPVTRGGARAIGTYSEEGAQTDTVKVESPNWYCMNTKDLTFRGKPIGPVKPPPMYGWPPGGVENLRQPFTYNSPYAGYTR